MNPDFRAVVVLLAVSAAVLGACTSTPAAPVSAVPAPTTTLTAPAVSTTTAVAVFRGTVSPVTAADLPASWRRGCPVEPADLRLLHLTYQGFDGDVHAGSLVVHTSVTGAVIEVFRLLFERRFPIRRMEPVDAFGGSDDASTAADNTSGFNCRNAVSNGPAHWSAHAYGRAIDVNPVENPYILDGAVLPPAGSAFRDRADLRPGMAVRGGDLTAAFTAAGWSWGGVWASPDYQHFSETGN